MKAAARDVPEGVHLQQERASRGHEVGACACRPDLKNGRSKLAMRMRTNLFAYVRPCSAKAQGIVSLMVREGGQMVMHVFVLGSRVGRQNEV